MLGLSHNRIARSASFVALASALLMPSVASAACDLSLTNANVWNGKGYEKRTLSIKGGRFTDDISMPVSVDASFLYLTPPFADAHNHRIDTLYPGESPNDNPHTRAIAQGIFYALNPNNMRLPGPTLTGQTGLVDLQAAGGGLTRPGGHPQPLYEGLAKRGILGPMTAADLPGKAFHLVTTPAEARDAVAKVKANGASVIKLYLLDHDSPDGGDGLSAENFAAAVAEAKKLGLHTLVHIENAVDFRRAVAAKVHAIVHLPYYMGKDRNAADLMLSADDAAAAAAKNVFVVATVSVAHSIYDGEKLGAMQAVQHNNLTVLRAAGVRMGLGADQWTLNIHDEISVIRSFAIFDSAEIVNMATTNGAEIAFPGRKIGKIEAGYEASFVAWFRPLTSGWAEVREPSIGMRGGDAIIDKIGYFAKACPKPESSKS